MEDIECNNCGVKFSDYQKLQDENKKLRDIFNDFITTKVYHQTWCEEMYITIFDTLKEIDNE